MKHFITDLTTGEVQVEDIPSDVDPTQWMRQRMDDCPLCKEARARGEVPQFHDAESLREFMADFERQNPALARRIRGSLRRPRWRHLKRRAR